MAKKRKSTKRVETALPFHQFSREMLTMFVRHNLNASTICVYHYLSLNQDINRGRTHDLKIEDIAEALDIEPRTVYLAVAKLKEVGLFTPTNWGSVGGTLAYAQLVKHTAAQAKHEKKEKGFYKEILDRIKQYERKERVLVTKTQVQNYFVQVYGERKDTRGYYPTEPDANRHVFEKLEYYFPESKESDLYPGTDV